MSVHSEPGVMEGHLPEGCLLRDRYRVLGLLAVGGMSAVYKAQDLRFPNVRRICAVKEMVNSADSPETRAIALRNFERETSILASLSHPGIVQIYNCFTEGKRSYVVLEFVQGKDLETVLSETRGFLSEGQVVNWALQVCAVLEYLHSHEPRPIVFRDIKPSNLMLDNHGQIRLIDFGIAKVFNTGEKGTMIGTEGYSPPEQYRGVADPRVDIYALGATLHHLLTKRDPRTEPPFTFDTCPIQEANPSVSLELVKVVHRALEYDVDDRYLSAAEMGRALTNLPSAGSSKATVRLETPTDHLNGVTPLWRFASEDEIRSSPAVDNRTLYVGAYDHNLYALDAETGEFLWKYPTGGGIASSPCVYEGIALFGSVDHALYAVDADTGRVRWTCPTQGKVWSSPRAAFGHVFFGSDDRHLYAVNVQGGRVAWKFEADGKVRSSPAVGEEAIYVGCEAGTLYAVDMSGNTRWRFRARRGVTSSPALAREMVYVGGRDRYVYGVDAQSGWLIWRYRTGGPVISSPTVDDKVVFIGSADGHLYALDAETGRLVWRHATGSQVTSSPVVFNDSVYFGSVDGHVHSLDTQTGDLRWRFQTGGQVTSSPTAAHGLIYIGSSDRYVYALPA